jgi:hypothetical protein
MKIYGTSDRPAYPIPYEYHVVDSLREFPTEPFYISQLSEDGKFINFYSYWLFGEEPKFEFKFPISYLESMKNMRG